MKKLAICSMILTLALSAGGHSWRNWRLYLTDFAQKLFR